MTEYTTAEAYVMAQLKKLADENALLKKEIEELKADTARVDEDNPRVYRVDEPIEVCTVQLKTKWYYGDSNSGIKDMTAAEIREAIKSREGLVEIARKKVGNEQILYVNRVSLPYQIKALGLTAGFDVNTYWGNDALNIHTYPVHNSEKLNTSGYFPIERADELFELGLQELKKELEKYAEKLEARND